MDSVNHFENSVEDDNEEIRKKDHMAKLQLFRAMGLYAKDKKTTTAVVRKKRKQFNREKLNNSERMLNEPVRKSVRESRSSVENTSLEESVSEWKEEIQVKREFSEGPEPMIPVSNDMEDVKPSLQNLVPFCSEVPSGVSIKGIQESLHTFKKRLKTYSLSPEDVKKVGSTKTYSLLIHPSESKLLIITGDGNGYMSFWDVNNSDSEVEMYRPHKDSIHCLSLSPFNPLKLYATAVDGVVRSCDLEKFEFNDIYVTSEHTVYHAQMSPHTLLVAHGCGDVGLVDIRESKNPSRWIECHRKSVRTIHQHPLHENEFVTASGVGEVGIWDIRKTKKQTALLLLPHPKGVKSAYFSPGGGMLLTTCNDHKIRLYEACKNKLIMSTSQNLHSGRWLRPLTAVWHPIRDDVFVIGSMNKPREIHIFGINGIPLHQLKSPNLSSILSNCCFHQTQTVIAGANSSGYVHIFRGTN